MEVVVQLLPLRGRLVVPLCVVDLIHLLCGSHRGPRYPLEAILLLFFNWSLQNLLMG